MSTPSRSQVPELKTPHRDGLKLRDGFIAAAVRCAPPDNKPTPQEIADCLPHLEPRSPRETVQTTL